MEVLFLEKSDKFNYIKSLIKPIDIHKSKIIINKDLSKLNLPKIQKLVATLKRLLILNKIDKIVISEELKTYQELTNLIISNNINICENKWLFKRLINELIDKILQDKRREKSEIWITINDIDILGVDTIYNFAKEFKRVNIITNHIEKFKNIERKLYLDEGILITVTNNRRKSLLKADLILNVDFPKDVFNKFAIFDDAVIINWEDDLKIKKKRFNGKVINDIIVENFDDSRLTEFIDENDLEGFDINDICEILNIVPNKIDFTF